MMVVMDAFVLVAMVAGIGRGFLLHVQKVCAQEQGHRVCCQGEYRTADTLLGD